MVEFREVIVQETYTADQVYVDAFVALIDKKKAAFVLDMFCNDIPLQNYGLNHLKRIQPLDRTDKTGPLQIVVCPVKCYDEVPNHIKDVCKELRTVTVCKLAPACRSEFESWNKNWPINFHATQLEKDRERGLDSTEIAQLNAAHQRLLEDQTELLNLGITNGGLIINPENGKVVATVRDALNVLRPRFATNASETVSEGQDSAAMDRARFGSSMFRNLYTPTMLCIEAVAAAVRIDDANLPENAYLCSGMDLYLTQEPDQMSSMALVHSRIRRVFFMHSDPVSGALQSGRGHIHSLRALNHHYRVFQFGEKVNENSETASS